MREVQHPDRPGHVEGAVAGLRCIGQPLESEQRDRRQDDLQHEAGTLAELNVTITVTDEGVFLNDTVQVIATNIVTINGIIHVIDAVLLPPQ